MRHNLLFATSLLLLACAVEAASPARADANGASGVCPETAAQAANQAAHAEPAPPHDPAAAPERGLRPAPAKPAAVARPRPSTRWQSFVPGMFK